MHALKRYCSFQGSAYFAANANAMDYHKASINFHYPQYACLPGRIWKTQQTEWHRDVSSLPQPIFVRAELARITGLKAAFAIPLARQVSFLHGTAGAHGCSL